MKRFFTILLLCLLSVTHSYADSTGTGAAPQPVVNTPAKEKVTTVKADTTTEKQEINETLVAIISLSPFGLFLLFFVLVLAGNGWSRLFHDALTDKDAQPIATSEQPLLDTRGRQVHVENMPQTEMVHVYPKSTSRLIMFCSSFTAIFISLSIISASIYGFLVSGTMPNFTSVIGLVLSLGIGVIPYMTNKLKAAPTATAVNAPAARGNLFNAAPVNYMTSSNRSQPVNINEQPPTVTPTNTPPPKGGQQQPK